MTGKTMALVRGVTVIGATSALIAGATFAATWQSSASLSGNTFSSETANLLVSKYDDNNKGTVVAGYNFVLVPGLSNAYPVRLYNTGSANLSLGVNVGSINFGAAGIDSSHVKVDVYGNAAGSGGVLASETLSAAANGQAINDFATLAAGSNADYSVRFDSDNQAVQGAGGGMTPGFDIVFTGTAHQ